MKLVDIPPRSDRRDSIRVRLSLGDDLLTLVLPETLMGQCVRALDGALVLDDLPLDLGALLLEAAFRDDLDRLETVYDCRVVIEAVTRGGVDIESDGVDLVAEHRAGSWPIRVEAANGSPLLKTLTSRWPVAPRAMSRFPLPAVVRLGTTRLRYDQLASLQPGDAVLMQFTEAKGARLVVCESFLAAARNDDGRWVVAEPPRKAARPEKREWTMDQDSDAAKPDQPITDVDALPMQLAFDIGQVSMTMGALRHLDVGAVVELNRDVQELVRISANGALVGHGELVDVEGRVGVRIVRLFDHG